MSRLVKFSDRQFGCEFEFNSNRGNTSPIAANAIRHVYGNNSVVDTNQWMENRNNYRKWYVKEDASVEFEVVTPISKWKDMKKISAVVNIWHKIGKNILSTNKEAGFHVHVEKREETNEQLLIAWLLIEPSIAKCFPSCRGNQNGCSSIFLQGNNKRKMLLNKKKFNHLLIRSKGHGNAIDLQRRETCEFRICEGHFDPIITRNWVKFCILFMNFAQRIKAEEYVDRIIRPFNSITTVLNRMSVKDREVIQFIKQRHRKAKK